VEKFEGVIARYHHDATPWWPAPDRAPAGTPNVVLVVLDDVGFAQLGCFGSDIATPALDALAAGGLRYTNFHTTSLCSPTRACLLTGRNHHSVGMGRIIELATGFPGYNARIPRSAGLLPEMLVPQGFAAWAVGKWHSHAGRRVPRGGVARALGARARVRALVRLLRRRDAPVRAGACRGQPPDRAAEDDRAGLPPHGRPRRPCDRPRAGPARDRREKPFFLYLCTAACHSPHQAPPEWIARYRGRFDRGWDVWREDTLARQIAAGIFPRGTALSPRPRWVAAWDSLSADERRLYARFMEAFAGFLTHTDHHLGRLFSFLAETGDLDNTLIVALSDNGASSEGGPHGSVNDLRPWNMVPRPVDEAIARIDEIGGPRCHNNYPWGWTVAGNTPFRRWKRETHEGGVADPLIVHWPRGIAARGELAVSTCTRSTSRRRSWRSFASSRPPRSPASRSVRSRARSFAYTLDAPDAPDRHTTQYYEMFGCRAIYHHGWKAVTYHPMQDTCSRSTTTSGSSTTSRPTRPSATIAPRRSPRGFAR
jgi:arylsulfatase